MEVEVTDAKWVKAPQLKFQMAAGVAASAELACLLAPASTCLQPYRHPLKRSSVPSRCCAGRPRALLCGRHLLGDAPLEPALPHHALQLPVSLALRSGGGWYGLALLATSLKALPHHALQPPMWAPDQVQARLARLGCEVGTWRHSHRRMHPTAVNPTRCLLPPIRRPSPPRIPTPIVQLL